MLMLWSTICVELMLDKEQEVEEVPTTQEARTSQEFLTVRLTSTLVGVEPVAQAIVVYNLTKMQTRYFYIYIRPDLFDF